MTTTWDDVLWVQRWADELEALLTVWLRRMDQLGYPPAPPPTIDGRQVGD